MDCSIVIPAFNEADRLAATLAKIREAAEGLSVQGWTYEIIVCDNNSSDRTAEVAGASGAITVFEPINQIARARNSGAKVAKGEWLLFVDADTWPSAGIFREMHARMVDDRLNVGGGALIQMDSKGLICWIVERVWAVISLITQWAAGSFLFCRRQVFIEVGGFNENLYASEEIDLSIKLKKWARKNRQVFSIIRHHPVCTSGRKLHLYKTGDMLRFGWMVLRSPRKALTQRESCFFWYDGRR